MAENTLWKSLQTIPSNTLVLVYGDFMGYALRSLTDGGDWYDEYEIYDESGMEWDLWTELPIKPGPKTA